MYYVIDKEYVGVNADEDQYVDSQTIQIRTSPATDLNGSPVISGHCSTLNDWMTYTHGEYETIDAARMAISAIYGETRVVGPGRAPHDYSEESVVEAHKVGRYEPMSRMATSTMLGNSDITVTADTTDAQIEQMVEDIVDEFRFGADLDPDANEVRKSLRMWRDERIAEAEED